MCCGEEMHGRHAAHVRNAPLKSMVRSISGCGGQRFLSRKERARCQRSIEIRGASLRVQEELQGHKKEPRPYILLLGPRRRRPCLLLKLRL
jgi:hypothetical protein